MIQKEKRDLYSGKRIQIPSPRFVVFYNGTEEQPERKILRLSDSFYRQTEESNLELTVLCIEEGILVQRILSNWQFDLPIFLIALLPKPRRSHRYVCVCEVNSQKNILRQTIQNLIPLYWKNS